MSASPSTPPDNDPRHWTSPFEELLGDRTGAFGADHTGPHVQQPDPIIGTPSHDAAFWEGQQRLPDDCAIKCQQFILNQFTGHNVDENMLVHEAMEHGWYQPGAGTSPANVGNLLELHGIGVHRYEHASQFHLGLELAQGHKVIVGVDSAKLLGEDPIMSAIRDALGTSGADHAVVVSGLDTSDPLHPGVIVSDPGTGEAIGRYPLEQFLDAWRGSDFFMMATNDPAPSHLPEMAHFDYALGHIPEVADLSYEQFLTFADHPMDLPQVVHHYVEVHHFVHFEHHFDNVPAVDVLHPDSHAIADGHVDLVTDHPVDDKHDFKDFTDHHSHVQDPVDWNDDATVSDKHDFTDHHPDAQDPVDWSTDATVDDGHSDLAVDDPSIDQTLDDLI